MRGGRLSLPSRNGTGGGRDGLGAGTISYGRSRAGRAELATDRARGRLKGRTGLSPAPKRPWPGPFGQRHVGSQTGPSRSTPLPFVATEL
jgi:hypothetical protein